MARGKLRRSIVETVDGIEHAGAHWEAGLFFFALSSVLLALVLVVLIVGAAGSGLLHASSPAPWPLALPGQVGCDAARCPLTGRGGHP